MKILALTCSLFIVTFVLTQQSPQFNLLPTNTSNQNPKAYCGIGTVTITPSQLPNQNLHIHGANILTRNVSSPKLVIGSPTEGTIGGQPLEPGSQSDGAGPSYSVNYGYTAGIAFTNQTTGTGLLEGGVLRMSENEFVLENLEELGDLKIFSPKDLRISNSLSSITFNKSNRGIFVNNSFTPSTSLELASFNIGAANNNGLQIRTLTSGKYGLSVRMANDNDIAIQIYNSAINSRNFAVNGLGEVIARVLKVDNQSGNTNFMVTNAGAISAREIEIKSSSNNSRNFSVKNNGEVFARKYTTTLANIPDYVFEKDYQLMPLNELKSYIRNNKHLPKIPSAKEIESKNGEVDLGEMNRLLLEKLEETTLYIFQLEERIKALEEKKK